MKYQITIRELTPFTEDEIIEMNKRTNPYNGFGNSTLDDRFSDKPFHTTRVVECELSREEFEKVKKGIFEIL